MSVPWLTFLILFFLTLYYYEALLNIYRRSSQKFQANYFLQVYSKVETYVGSNKNILTLRYNITNSKTSKKRLERRTNLQFVKPISLSCTTNEIIGISLAYKIIGRSIIGLDIRDNRSVGSIHYIKFCDESIELGSFINRQIKKQLYAKGCNELCGIPAFKIKII